MFFVVPEVSRTIFAGDELNAEKVRREMREAINEIKNNTAKLAAGSDDFCPAPNKLCPWCDFRDLCPARP